MFSKKTYWLIFAAILFFAAFLRLYKLGSIPFSLYWDEAAMYVDVKSVLETGRDMHNRPWYQVIYPSYGDFKLPIYIWLATFSSKLLGLSEFALRLPSALAGLGTVVVAGYIARELLSAERNARFSQVLQLSTMFIVAVSPWSIVFSRTGFEGHIGQFFLALSLLMVVLSPKKKSLILLAPIFGAIATYAYFSVRFVWVGVFVPLVLLLALQQKSKKQIPSFLAVHLFFPLILFALLLLPMLRSPLYEDTNRFRLGTDSVLKNETEIITSNVYREFAGNAPVDRVLFHRLWLTGRELLLNYSDNISLNFLFVQGDPNLRHGTGRHGLFLTVFLPFFFIGIYKLFSEYKQSFFLLMLWWVLALLPASVPENTPHALRSLNALVPLAIVIGLGLAVFIEWLLQRKNVLMKNMAYAVLTLFFISSLASFSYHYFTHYPYESARDWQGGYKPLAQELLANNSAQHTYVLPFDDRFYLWMMGYGPYKAKDFHSWKSEGYQFAKSIPNVSFTEPDQSKITQGLVGIKVAGRKEQLEHFLSQNSLVPKEKRDVLSENEQSEFVIAEF